MNLQNDRSAEVCGRALVTGGAGFIGSHLVELLVRSGCAVRVLDNLSSGSADNLHAVQRDVELISGDVRDESVCRSACSDVDWVFHLAAIPSVTNSVEDPQLTHAVTLGGTLNMLVAARDAGANRFVFSSSASVYGDADTVPTVETQAIMPKSPYAVAKAAGEFYCKNFAGLYGMSTVCLRYFNVFGARQSAASGYAAVVPLFVDAVLNGRRPTVYGDGLQTRDFVHVSNVVNANIAAARSENTAGESFNIACGEGSTLLQLLESLERHAGRKVEPIFAPARPGDVRHSRASIEKAVRLLDWKPSISLDLGLQIMVKPNGGDVTAPRELAGAGG